jgi:uncharacterized protein YdhG (YjbR/CyaY superfamily)
MRPTNLRRSVAEKKRTTDGGPKSATEFTKEERAAMRARVKEMRASADKAENERLALEAIAAMQPSSRAMAERIHAIVKVNAPALSPKTWYGMPAYAKEDQVICFFRPAEKFGTRYSTFGFSDEAKIDEGHMWPTDFALTQLTAAEEARIAALVKRAVG